MWRSWLRDVDPFPAHGHLPDQKYALEKKKKKKRRIKRKKERKKERKGRELHVMCTVFFAADTPTPFRINQILSDRYIRCATSL